MIINQLFVDKFRGRDTLRIEALASRLNVIQLPGEAEAAELHALIPSVLSDEDSAIEQEEPNVYGAFVVQVGDASFELRLRAGRNGSTKSVRQLLDDDGRLLAPERLVEALKPLNTREYLALYTDHLAPVTRIGNWPQWLRHESCTSRTLVAPKSATSVQAATDRRQKLQARLLETRNQLRAQHESLQRTLHSSNESRCGGAATQRSATAPAETPPPSVAQFLGEKTTVSPLALRKAYFAARAQQKVLQERLETARQQQQSITTALANCERALSLYDNWCRKQELESSLTEVESFKVRGEHNRRLEQVEQQIVSVSRELRAARQRRSTLAETDAVSPEPNDEAWDRVLEAGVEAVRCQLRIEQTRRQIAKRSQKIDSPEATRSPDELRKIIRQIRSAAADWRAARQQWQQRRTPPDNDSVAAPASNRHEASNLEQNEAAQTTQLRDEIRRVQRQTHHLLQPQLLSRPALIAIGLLFVGGAMCLLAGFFLHMPGSNWTFCLIGLSSMFSASLLKWNLERPPIGRLRAQRTQIAELMNRMEASRAPDNLKRSEPDIPRSPSAAPRTNHGIRTATDQAAWSELVAAEKRWRDLLQQYELPMNLTPRGVIAHVRTQLRAMEPEPTASLKELHAELQVDEVWLANWRQQCGQLLFPAARSKVCDRQSETDQRGTSVGRPGSLAAPPSADEPDERIQQLSPQQLLDRLSAHRTRLQQTQLEARELAAREQARRDLIKLQRQRKRLIQKRQAILADAGVESPEELQQKLGELRRAEEWKQELQTLCAGLDRQICESSQPQAIQELLAIPSRVELQELADRESAELERLNAETRRLQEEASVLDQQVGALTQPSNEHRVGWQRKQLARQIERIEQQLVAVDLAGIIQASVQPRRKAQEENAVQRATKWLRRIWDRPELDIVWDGDGDGDNLLVVDGDTSQRLTELADSEQHQVVACLQIALISIMARRRIHLPILLRDTILVGPPSMARRFAALLCEIATSGQQILLLTSDTSVAAWFQELGMPTLIVSRTPQPQLTESKEPVGATG